MAKTNYTYEKRQKELAKQKKQADKLLKKTAQKAEHDQNDDQLQLLSDENSTVNKQP
ncbi:MAG: hypothetical protein R8K48_09220 [Gallionella sp.]